VKAILAFAARNYIAWSAFKLGAFIGCLIGMLYMSFLLLPAIVGRH
jgi:hypothetical protein